MFLFYPTGDSVFYLFVFEFDILVDWLNLLLFDFLTEEFCHMYGALESQMCVVGLALGILGVFAGLHDVDEIGLRCFVAQFGEPLHGTGGHIDERNLLILRHLFGGIGIVAMHILEFAILEVASGDRRAEYRVGAYGFCLTDHEAEVFGILIGRAEASGVGEFGVVVSKLNDDDIAFAERKHYLLPTPFGKERLGAATILGMVANRDFLAEESGKDLPPSTLGSLDGVVAVSHSAIACHIDS